jgi:hypothetical protein
MKIAIIVILWCLLCIIQIKRSNERKDFEQYIHTIEQQNVRLIREKVAKNELITNIEDSFPEKNRSEERRVGKECY